MNVLKHVLLATSALFAFSSSAQCASLDADVKQVVETFYKQYYRDFVKRNFKGDYDAQVIKWINASPETSPRFKKALAKALIDARKKDPEVGLDADPILAGQDYPEKGYRARTIKITADKAAVTMEGIGSKDFHISLELVNTKGQWLIDRIGDIPATAK